MLKVICMVHKLEKLVSNYKPKTYLLSCTGDIHECLHMIFPWEFHQCQQIVGGDEQTLGLIQM